jgi:hypothetical protein
MLQVVAVSTPDGVTDFINGSNPSCRTMDPEFTQPLTEMITEDISGGNAWRASKVDNSTANYEPTKWDPRQLINL